jgi:hypothetical protein
MSAFGRKQTMIPLNLPCNAHQLKAMINVLERNDIQAVAVGELTPDEESILTSIPFCNSDHNRL